MAWNRLAAVGTGMVLAAGLTSTPASAAPVTTRFENQVAPLKCLDYYAARGIYLTSCNSGDFQEWIWNNDPDSVTALRQVASRLCLTLRNDQLAMKPCAAADEAARWFITSSTPGGRMIQNTVSGKCLARMGDEFVSTAACIGGPSQRWKILP